MSGYIIVLSCNTLLFGVVLFFFKAELFKRFGHHRFMDIAALGFVCFAFYLFCFFNAADIDKGAAGIAMFTALPWVLLYTRVVMSAASGVADTIFGMDTELLDRADLKLAHKYLRKGNRPEAINELRLVRARYPDAYSPLFLLAIITEEDNQIDNAVDLYRQIIQKHSDNILPWTNAARNLSDLLRNRLNDSSAADHLDAEILKRNPDTRYKYSMTRKPTKKKRSKKNRNVYAERADINHARRLVSRGELPTAIALIKRYIDENPDDSREHFELISLFERVERNDEAIIWLQKVIRDFSDDDHAWGEAMLRLAGLRDHSEKDAEAAVGLLEQVAKRLKTHNHGRVARDHLKAIRNRGD